MQEKGLIRAPLYGILAVNNLADLVITDQPTKHLSADYFFTRIYYLSTQSTSVIAAKQLWVQSFYCKNFYYMVVDTWDQVL